MTDAVEKWLPILVALFIAVPVSAQLLAQGRPELLVFAAALAGGGGAAVAVLINLVKLYLETTREAVSAGKVAYIDAKRRVELLRFLREPVPGLIDPPKLAEREIWERRVRFRALPWSDSLGTAAGARLTDWSGGEIVAAGEREAFDHLRLPGGAKVELDLRHDSLGLAMGVDGLPVSVGGAAADTEDPITGDRRFDDLTTIYPQLPLPDGLPVQTWLTTPFRGLFLALHADGAVLEGGQVRVDVDLRDADAPSRIHRLLSRMDALAATCREQAERSAFERLRFVFDTAQDDVERLAFLAEVAGTTTDASRELFAWVGTHASGAPRVAALVAADAGAWSWQRLVRDPAETAASRADALMTWLGIASTDAETELAARVSAGDDQLLLALVLRAGDALEGAARGWGPIAAELEPSPATAAAAILLAAWSDVAIPPEWVEQALSGGRETSLPCLERAALALTGSDLEDVLRATAALRERLDAASAALVGAVSAPVAPSSEGALSAAGGDGRLSAARAAARRTT